MDTSVPWDGDFTAVHYPNGDLAVMGNAGVDDSLNVLRLSGSTWSVEAPSDRIVRYVSVFARPNGQLMAFGLGTDDRVYSLSQNAAGAWASEWQVAWAQPTGAPLATIAGGINAANNLQIFYTLNNGDVQSTEYGSGAPVNRLIVRGSDSICRGAQCVSVRPDMGTLAVGKRSDGRLLLTYAHRDPDSSGLQRIVYVQQQYNGSWTAPAYFPDYDGAWFFKDPTDPNNDSSQNIVCANYQSGQLGCFSPLNRNSEYYVNAITENWNPPGGHTRWTQLGRRGNFVCADACLSAIPLARYANSGNFNTALEKWYVATDTMAGWQASNLNGRTIYINGVQVQPGRMALPLPASDGQYYFRFTAGSPPSATWTSWSYWEKHWNSGGAWPAP